MPATRRPAWPVALALAVLAAAPAGRAGDDDALSPEQLGYGYAQFYDATDGLRHSDKLLLVKLESAAVDEVISALARDMRQLREGLHALAEAHPEVRLDDQGLPVIEQRKRKALMRSRLAKLKPLTGRSGREFERTLLQAESSALTNLVHLVDELDAADPDARRSAFLRGAKATVERNQDRIRTLLEREYFR